jgi:rod shape-determining protein MreD
MRKFLFYSVTFAAGIALQIVGPKVFSPFGINPHYLLIMTLFFSLVRGPLVGETLGFLWGLSADSISVELFGAQAFLLAIVGFIGGRMNKTLDESKPWAQIVFVFIMSLIFILGLYGLYQMFAERERHISIFIVLIHPFMNAVLAPAIFWVLRIWVQIWFPKSRQRIRL